MNQEKIEKALKRLVGGGMGGGSCRKPNRISRKRLKEKASKWSMKETRKEQK